MGFSLAAVTGAIVAPYIGRYLDHGSARKLLLWGTVIIATCYVLLASVDNLIEYFLVVSIGMGVGMVCMGGQAWHRSVISWFDHWRGRAISFAVLGASLAGIAMPPVVNALIELYGWSTAYLLFGGTTLIVLFPVIYLFMKDRPEEIGEVRDGHAYVNRHASEVIEIAEDLRSWTLGEMYRSPAFWSIGVIFGSMTCVFTAVMMHLFSHLQDIGFDSSDASFIMSATAAFAALGKPVIGWLADYFGAKVAIGWNLPVRVRPYSSSAQQKALNFQFWQHVFTDLAMPACRLCARSQYPQHWGVKPSAWQPAPCALWSCPFYCRHRPWQPTFTTPLAIIKWRS